MIQESEIPETPRGSDRVGNAPTACPAGMRLLMLFKEARLGDYPFILGVVSGIVVEQAAIEKHSTRISSYERKAYCISDEAQAGDGPGLRQVSYGIGARNAHPTEARWDLALLHLPPSWFAVSHI